MLTEGLTEIMLEKAPDGFQVYVKPPLTVKVPLVFGQLEKELGLTLIIGILKVVTATVFVEVHGI